MSDDSQSSTPSRSKKDRRLAYGFGIAFVAAILIIALYFPDPSSFQRYVFRIVLGLAAAGVASTIDGFLQVRISPGIRAGGALGIFLIVYLVSPETLFRSDGVAPPSNGAGERADTTMSEWAPEAVSDYDDVMCRNLRTEEIQLSDSPGGDYFAVENAGNPIAASVSEVTAKEMLKLARRHTHQCVIGLGTAFPVVYWYGETGAEVAPPTSNDCFSYVPERLDFGPPEEEDGTFTIGTAEEGVMLTVSSRDIGERALALARDHDQLCFLGFDAYVQGRNDCGELSKCWTMFWRR